MHDKGASRLTADTSCRSTQGLHSYSDNTAPTVSRIAIVILIPLELEVGTRLEIASGEWNVKSSLLAPRSSSDRPDAVYAN
jgi:hypothetical protein